ncbi:MAG TPA: DUF6636 domain-containing protein [Kineosporiaceae bacterium]|nr:DUF6636 domain-containing protein [Kineosporiaceae bacterium]
MRAQAMFSSPSKNISCWMEGVDARCDIAERSWKAPAKPSSCELDYGQGMSLHAGSPGFTCAGDTVLGQATILPYGEAMLVGANVCSSLQSGMRCVDLTSKHGFFLSRDGYQLF